MTNQNLFWQLQWDCPVLHKFYNNFRVTNVDLGDEMMIKYGFVNLQYNLKKVSLKRVWSHLRNPTEKIVHYSSS